MEFKFTTTFFFENRDEIKEKESFLKLDSITCSINFGKIAHVFRDHQKLIL